VKHLETFKHYTLSVEDIDIHFIRERPDAAAEVSGRPIIVRLPICHTSCIKLTAVFRASLSTAAGAPARVAWIGEHAQVTYRELIYLALTIPCVPHLLVRRISQCHQAASSSWSHRTSDRPSFRCHRTVAPRLHFLQQLCDARIQDLGQSQGKLLWT
jgi:hypothetical protein